MHDTLPLLDVSEFPEISRYALKTLQVNLGYKCNQRCLHCHVNAGPHRTEMMDEKTLMLIPEVLRARKIETLDLTGGAPELHEGFRNIVYQSVEQGVHVIDRCNLTVLFEPGQHDLAEFLAENKVEVVASLPCYSLENVDKQRGDGVFEKSIRALQLLNSLGYGRRGSGLVLNLVYNPQGPSLPPNQEKLEADYKRELMEHFGVAFNALFVLANLPINRFGSMLVSKGQFEPYMTLLKNNYSADNVSSVMCRTLISVDWQGHLFDCDFNQQLAMKAPHPMSAKTQLSAAKAPPTHLRDLLELDFKGNRIAVADHCYGCTAGQGSSCGGAL